MNKPSEHGPTTETATASGPPPGAPGREGPPGGGLPTIDVNEYGGKRGGERQAMNRRLFMQFLAFTAPSGADGQDLAARVVGLVRERAIKAVVYADLMNPR